jgi:hypothetical protein
MAITISTTGSQWMNIYGTYEECVNYLMTSGIGTGNVCSVNSPTAGSMQVLYQK